MLLDFLPDHTFFYALCLLVICNTAHNLYCIVTSPQWTRSFNPLDIIPYHFKNFYVVSREGEQAVKSFYIVQDASRNEAKAGDTQIVQHLDLTPYEVKKMLKKLFSVQQMWQKLDEVGAGDAAVQQWASLLLDTFYLFTHRGLARCRAIKDAWTAREATRFMNQLVKYSKLLTHPGLSACPYFRATLLETLLRLSAQDGFMPAYLVFAHLQPHMVNDNCYPVLNNETNVYQQHVSYESVWAHSHLKPLLEQYDEFIIL